MSVTISKSELDLREELTQNKNKVQHVYETFWFDGDATTTDFPLPAGWEPFTVQVAGSGIYRPGAGEDYTVSFDGFIYTVVMAVAPPVTDILIIARKEM